MPTRNFAVTGTPCGDAAATHAATMFANSRRLYGSAAPPPRRVTFATGQPQLVSMWSASPSPMMILTASRMVAGSTP